MKIMFEQKLTFKELQRNIACIDAMLAAYTMQTGYVGGSKKLKRIVKDLYAMQDKYNKQMVAQWGQLQK